MKVGLCLLIAAVATLQVSALALRQEDERQNGVRIAKDPARSEWTLNRVSGHVANLAEGVLFSLALGFAGTVSTFPPNPSHLFPPFPFPLFLAPVQKAVTP